MNATNQQNIPQGLKPQLSCTIDGTAEAVPFQDPI
jgi:hypothetical protein